MVVVDLENIDNRVDHDGPPQLIKEETANLEIQSKEEARQQQVMDEMRRDI